jgi:hypothetical protein
MILSPSKTCYHLPGCDFAMNNTCKHKGPRKLFETGSLVGVVEVQRTACEVLIGVGCDGQCTAPWMVNEALVSLS